MCFKPLTDVIYRDLYSKAFKLALFSIVLTPLILLVFFTWFDKTEEVDEPTRIEKNILMDLVKDSEYTIDTKPRLGNYIKNKDMLKKVRTLIKEEKEKKLCEVNGLYQILKNEQGKYYKVLCVNKEVIKDKILTRLII